MKSVAIIGAGGAGLAMARYLSANPSRFQFEVYEQSNEIGGTWIYDCSLENHFKEKHRRYGNKELIELINKDDIHSSMYKSLRYANLSQFVLHNRFMLLLV